MSFKKGHKKLGGRKKGTPNIAGVNVKDAIMGVFVGIGGTEAMIRWGQKHRSEFYTKVLPRVLPKEITGEIGVGVGMAIVEEIVDGNASDAHHANGKAEPQAGGV